MKTIFAIQNLADKRIGEAKLLYDAGYYEGAFYLAGYSVELMLKARICKNLGIEDFYLKQAESVRKAFFVHLLDQLLTLSGLRTQFEDEIDPSKENNEQLNRNWNKICSWNETARYNCDVSAKVALSLIDAIEDPKNGFLSWVQKNW